MGNIYLRIYFPRKNSVTVPTFPYFALLQMAIYLKLKIYWQIPIGTFRQLLTLLATVSSLDSACPLSQTTCRLPSAKSEAKRQTYKELKNVETVSTPAVQTFIAMRSQNNLILLKLNIPNYKLNVRCLYLKLL